MHRGMGGSAVVRISFDNSEETYIDRNAGRYMVRNALVNARWFSALSPGEESRKCEVCGSEYVPKSRTQKYCGKSCAARAAYQMKKAR